MWYQTALTFQAKSCEVNTMVTEAERLGSALLRLADDNPDPKRRDLSVGGHFPYMKSATPSRMIIPLQESLTCTLPSTSEMFKTYEPFTDPWIEISSRCFIASLH